MNIKYFGQSCFSAIINNKHLLFDPFITPNDLAKSIIDVDSVPADYILLTHGHSDHIADCARIAGRTGAKVVCNFEISEWLQKQGIPNTHAMNTGGKWNFGDFTVKCTTAHHSSGLPDGSYGGNPMGFVIISNEGNFYNSGDTALTLDMQLVPRWAKLNFAVLPIGDNFTMDAADAAECSRMIECNNIMGVHYDTFEAIKIDHVKARQEFEAVGATLHLLRIGETKEL